MFCIFKRVIPPEICDLIIKKGLEKIEESDLEDTIASTGGSGQKSKKRKIPVENLATANDPANSYIRDTAVSWFDEPWVSHLFNPYFDTANQTHLRLDYDLTFTENGQFGQYLPSKDNTGQFYGWHQDGGTYFEDGTVRKLSLVCSLTCPTAYGEGELILDTGAYKSEEERYINAKEKMPKGSILVMTSDTYHKVNPITSGKRYSMVFWARGPKFK
tara:strand:- start:890 stop:1537 length:648 start_codon:yes stop_codon:yes gene_type:complete